MMLNIKSLFAIFALTLVFATLITLQTSSARESSLSTDHICVTVTDVFSAGDSIVKQIRIESNPNSRVKITSDKKGGGGLSASVGTVDGQPELGVSTITVLADHVEWKAGEVDALKFMMSMNGNGSKALMSDTGPMVQEKQLNELFAVLLRPGDYHYGIAIPILKFKDVTYSLTVEAGAVD